MKSLGDAIVLRNRLIEHLEEAGPDCAEKDRAALLTFVVAGGGLTRIPPSGLFTAMIVTPKRSRTLRSKSGNVELSFFSISSRIECSL